MKKRTIFARIAMTALIPCFALAKHDPLSLKHGTYVLASADCKEPPFAAMMSWDGVGFFGPHATRCKTSVLSLQGGQFKLSTTCTALGDGTLDSSHYVDTFALTRLSDTRFVIRKETMPESTYRWCSAEGANDRKEKR